MLTQKMMGYVSESVTLVSLKGNAKAGLCCIGRQFRAVGLCPEGVFVETDGKTQIVRKGRFGKLYLKVENNCTDNLHRFFYSTDGRHFHPAGEAFAMRAGFWKGIRTGLFCYGDGGKALFDFYTQHPLR